MAAGLQGYPARGVRLLRGLSFLSGALDAIAPPPRGAVAEPTRPDAELSVPALVVGLADEYDLLTEVGTPDGAGWSPATRPSRSSRGTPAGREDLLRALEHALSRRAGAIAS